MCATKDSRCLLYQGSDEFAVIDGYLPSAVVLRPLMYLSNTTVFSGTGQVKPLHSILAEAILVDKLL